MNKYGPMLFRSLALEAFYDIHISDKNVKKKELKWSKSHQLQPKNAMFFSFTL